MMLEIFQIDNDTFVFDFGNWNDRYGLNISKMDFYSRRKNLNQTKLVMLIDWVSQKIHLLFRKNYNIISDVKNIAYVTGHTLKRVIELLKNFNLFS